MIYSKLVTPEPTTRVLALLVKVFADAGSESDELLSYEFPHPLSVLHPQAHTRDLT